VCILVAVAAAAVAKPVETFVVTTPAIEILDPSGAIQRANVEQAIAAVQDELGGCRGSGWNSDALAWIVVDWHGKVTRVEIAVPKPDTEKCLTKVLMKLVVPAAQARATFVIRLRLERELVTDVKDLSPGSGKPVPPPSSTARVDIGRINVGAEFPDPERVRTIVHRHEVTLRACYATGVDYGATAANHVMLKLSIDLKGAVVGVQVAATASPREMVDCYKREVTKLMFPLPSKPATIEIEQKPPAS